MSWMVVDERYEVGLNDGKVVARAASGRSAGRELKTLPKALKDHPEVDRLRRLAAWLDRHASTCLEQVDTWMVSSLPVPTALLAAVWPDEAWQHVLRDTVIVGESGDDTGFLRGATDGEVMIVNLDGETVRLSPTTVTVPHPVLLDDLADLREFAAELGVTQRIDQVYRAIWVRPATVDPKATEIAEFAGGKFRTGSALAARSVSLGYAVSGGYATCRVRDDARVLTASTWIGEPYDYWESAETGTLSWRAGDGRTVPLGEVGPVAWSEGMRMAAALYAGRMIEEGKDA